MIALPEKKCTEIKDLKENVLMDIGCVCVTFVFVHILNVQMGTKVQNGPIKECSSKCTKCYWFCTFCACACGTF